MVDAPRLTGQDGKTLPWRQTGGASPLRAKWGKEPKEGTRKDDPPGRSCREKKALFTGCARVFLRNNEGQFVTWEKKAKIRG